jgi:hypothetical protein
LVEGQFEQLFSAAQSAASAAEVPQGLKPIVTALYAGLKACSSFTDDAVPERSKRSVQTEALEPTHYRLVTCFVVDDNIVGINRVS